MTCKSSLYILYLRVLEMKYRGVFKVLKVEDMPDYSGLKAIYLTDNAGREVYLEFPEKLTNVKIPANVNIELSLDNVKDEDYKSNWDVYMWGIVYYSDESRIRISIGGLIMELKNFNVKAEIGEKVYVGIKLLK